jgi:hypothetical protein
MRLGKGVSVCGWIGAAGIQSRISEDEGEGDDCVDVEGASIPSKFAISSDIIYCVRVYLLR